MLPAILWSLLLLLMWFASSSCPVKDLIVSLPVLVAPIGWWLQVSFGRARRWPNMTIANVRRWRRCSRVLLHDQRCIILQSIPTPRASRRLLIFIYMPTAYLSWTSVTCAIGLELRLVVMLGRGVGAQSMGSFWVQRRRIAILVGWRVCAVVRAAPLKESCLLVEALITVWGTTSVLGLLLLLFSRSTVHIFNLF